MRRLFTFTSFLFLLLCVTTVVLTARSYWRRDYFFFHEMPPIPAPPWPMSDVEIGKLVVISDHGWLILETANYSPTLGIADDRRDLWVPVPDGCVIVLTATLPICWLYFRKLQRRYTGEASASCLRCGYNLTGNTSGVCPECGMAVDGEAEPVT